MKKMLAVLAPAAVAALTSSLPVAAQGVDGAALFGQKCAVCHGRTGTPLPVFANQGVRNFRDPQWQSSKSDADIQKAIEDGKAGTLMRSFKKDLSKAQVEALVKHIRTLK